MKNTTQLRLMKVMKNTLPYLSSYQINTQVSFMREK